MEDSTSPATSNTSEVVWPTPAVPGQGIPWRNGDRGGDRTESQSPATGVPVGDRDSPNAEHAQVSALGTGPAEPDAGDRIETSGPPVPEPGPRVPDERDAPRALGEDHGPHASAGTVVPDGGSGTGDRAGASDETADEGDPLLDDLRAAIGRYVVLPSDEALTAVTLWVAASHIQPALQHAPRLAVVGPTKGCGKSRVLDVLHETVHQPMMTVNTSPAVVFRVIGKNPPTLLVDEADTIFGPKAGDKEDLRGLLNAGHQRNRPAWRISGPEHKPTAFPTFAMAALAGIGDLPDTIMDRAVVLRMQKRAPGERIAPFRSRYSVPELNALRDRLTAWLAPLRSTAEGLVPQMPVEDRAADTWEPLVIVADLAGGHWPSRARAACLAMTRNEVVQDEQTTLKTRLLRDVRRVFEREGHREALRSQDLLAALLQDAEAPWAEYGTKGLNAYHLANLLRDFGISPANHRFENGRQAKAYARNQFLDAWARYCPDPAQPAPAAGETVVARRAPGKPPAPPSGTLPIGPPGGPAGPRPTR
ncbi:hypothetical protein GCM10010365_04050 [Streptomyces poonensis]|uniref:DUF3631 domain-containing protein n=1 Tax=Streptomyces poonensis TaxID=68255 RepID=A0A918UCQ4_9ACTN|nr:hypothetical protein GCM10010365_04050 [Streptomyces poonensis]